MISRWLSWLNCLILGLALFFGLAGVVYWFQQPDKITCSGLQSKDCGLPKGSFELKEEAYLQAGESLLSLQQSPPTLQLPDLRTQLIYYGKNGRPDAQLQHTLLHFAINGANKSVVSIAPGARLYLIYDRKNTPARYSFSPNNDKTSLWIEGTPVDNEVQVRVTMENDKEEQIVEPEIFSQFRLPEKEFMRYGGTTWELGTFRVDGTLLARQKARWYGMDRFLERHGGDDFTNIDGKQRIDFGENDELYSVFVKAGDCLIWDQNRWKVISPGEESLSHPLLLVKKVDERLMTFELWDVEGKGKVLLNLLKSTEPWALQNSQALQQMFKFLGAKTKTQCVFEINRERVILRPSDWLLLTAKGWKKLSSEEDIDNYVKRKSPGTLFVFEGIGRKGEKQILNGMLYSPARHECQAVELSLQVKKPKTSKDISDRAKVAKDLIEAAQRATPATGQRLTQPPATSSASSTYMQSGNQK